MRINIIGSSGSGKSTLAKILGSLYDTPYLHIDTAFWDPNWVKNPERAVSEIRNMIQKDSWIIDGNYLNKVPERFKISDQIIFLDYNRFYCLRQVLKRYSMNKDRVRDSIGAGCNEKIDFEFIKYILWTYPHKSKKIVREIIKENRGKFLVFKSRRKLMKYLEQLHQERNKKIEILWR